MGRQVALTLIKPQIPTEQIRFTKNNGGEMKISKRLLSDMKSFSGHKPSLDSRQLVQIKL